MAKTTSDTLKLTLSFSIGFCDMATFRALLRGIPRITETYRDPLLLSFIPNVGLQARKAPSMDAPPYRFSSFYSVPNIAQIFQYNYRANSGRIDKPFRNNVVAVIAEAVNLLAQLFQMSLCRFRAFRLQRPFQSKIAILDLFPAPFTKEFIFTGYSGSIDSKVNTNHLPSRLKFWVFVLYHYMQKKIAVLIFYQIRTTNFPVDFASVVFRDINRNFFSAIHRQKRRGAIGKLDCCRSGIIANWAFSRSRLTCLFSGLNSRFRRLQSFRGFHARGNHELRRHPTLIAFTPIGKLMQLDAVNSLLSPTNLSHSIKRRSKLRNRFAKSQSLFRRQIQFQLQCNDSHTNRLGDLFRIVKRYRLNQPRLLPAINGRVSAALNFERKFG